MEDNAPVITGSSTENTLTIKAESGQTANVTLSGANIDVSGKGKAAVSTTGEGNVSIELDGGQHAQERPSVMPALKRTTAAA